MWVEVIKDWPASEEEGQLVNLEPWKEEVVQWAALEPWVVVVQLVVPGA